MELLERPNSIWFFVGIAASDFHGFPNSTNGLPAEEISRMDAEIRDRFRWDRNGDWITFGPGVDRDLGILTVNDEIVGWGMTCGLSRSWQPVSMSRLHESVVSHPAMTTVRNTLTVAYPDREDLFKMVDIYCFCDIHEGQSP